MKLKELRIKKGLNQSQMAKILKMSQTGYSQYETGRTEPNIRLLIQLSDYFHISVDELIDHQVPFILRKVDFSEQQLEVIEELKDLTDEDCRYLKASIYALKTAKENKEKYNYK